jgi:DNA-binding PadR family transcriptional regulator
MRLHVLHHAAHEPIFGVGIIEELKRHGYALSPGTLYPVLHELEQAGYIRSRAEVIGSRRRRTYGITRSGKAALALGKTKVWELFRELFEDELRFAKARHVRGTGPVDLKESPGMKKKLAKATTARTAPLGKAALSSRGRRRG